MTVLAVAFYKCPECERQAKCSEVRKRGEESWKYRRYECSQGHKFSTMEKIYKAHKGKSPDHLLGEEDE